LEVVRIQLWSIYSLDYSSHCNFPSLSYSAYQMGWKPMRTQLSRNWNVWNRPSQWDYSGVNRSPYFQSARADAR